MEFFSYFLKLLACFAGACAFAVIFNAPRRTVLISGVISLIEYFLYSTFLYIDMPYLFCFFTATLIASFLCEFAAMAFKAPSTVFSCIAVLILVPGVDIYRTVSMLVFGNYTLGAQTGVRALLSIGAMAMAVALSALVMRIVKKILSHFNVTER